MGGVGLQEVFILCFVGLAIRFQRQMRTETAMQDKPRAYRMLYVVYAVLGLITVRNPTMVIYMHYHHNMTNTSHRSVSYFA